MSIPAGAAIAATVFSYFSPTKSPFYSIITFSAVALGLAAEVPIDFLKIYVPVTVVTLISTPLSFNSKPDFTAEEYNNQIKFSRSLGISVAVICLVCHGRYFPEIQDDGNFSAAPPFFWIGYIAGVTQSFMYLLYIFYFP